VSGAAGFQAGEKIRRLAGRPSANGRRGGETSVSVTLTLVSSLQSPARPTWPVRATSLPPWPVLATSPSTWPVVSPSRVFARRSEPAHLEPARRAGAARLPGGARVPRGPATRPRRRTRQSLRAQRADAPGRRASKRINAAVPVPEASAARRAPPPTMATPGPACLARAVSSRRATSTCSRASTTACWDAVCASCSSGRSPICSIPAIGVDGSPRRFAVSTRVTVGAGARPAVCATTTSTRTSGSQPTATSVSREGS
jgi:hypothetical protein